VLATLILQPAITKAAMVEMLNVEAPSPPEPHVIDQHPFGLHAPGRSPHGAREAHQLVDRLPFHSQRHQKCGNLGRGRLARENSLHGRLRVRGAEVATLGDLMQCGISDMLY